MQRHVRSASHPRFFYGWVIVGTVFVQLMFAAGLTFYGLPLFLNTLTKQRGFSVFEVSLATSSCRWRDREPVQQLSIRPLRTYYPGERPGVAFLRLVLVVGPCRSGDVRTRRWQRAAAPPATSRRGLWGAGLRAHLRPVSDLCGRRNAIGPVAMGWLRPLSQERPKFVELVRVGPIPRPHAALLAMDQSGVDEHFEVVAHGGL